MKENKSEKIKVNLGDLLKKHSKDELATICEEITHEVCCKADELVQLFNKLHTTYPEIFGLVDFSMICTFTANAFPVGKAPLLCMQGTQEGIARAAQGIIEGLKEVSNGAVHDKETA